MPLQKTNPTTPSTNYVEIPRQAGTPPSAEVVARKQVGGITVLMSRDAVEGDKTVRGFLDVSSAVLEGRRDEGGRKISATAIGLGLALSVTPAAIASPVLIVGGAVGLFINRG